MKTIQTGEDLSGVHVWLVLWKAYSALRTRAEQSIESLGLGMSDFAILEILLHKGPMPVNAIGDRIQLTSGSISVAVERLAQKGLVERKEDADDRRTRMVHLTSAGRKLIVPAFSHHAAVMEEAAGVLSAQERRQLLTLLKKLGKSI